MAQNYDLQLLTPNANGFTVPMVGVWVQLVNNDTGVNYVSTGITNGTGKATFVPKPPGDSYIINTSSVSNSGPWTAFGISNHTVPVIQGDSPAFQGVTTVVGGPYAPNLPGATSIPTPAGVDAGKVWDYGGAVWNIRSFNAVGDNVTDDTQAIVNAMATASDGQTIFFPTPTTTAYAHTAITVTKRLIFQGSGGTLTGTALRYTPTTGTAWTWNYSAANLPTGPGMRDLFLNSNGAGANANTGIVLTSALGAYFLNVSVSGFGTALDTGGANSFLYLFEHCQFSTSGTRLLNMPTAQESASFFMCVFSNTGVMNANAIVIAGGQNITFQGGSFDNAQFVITGGQANVVEVHVEQLVNTTTVPILVQGGSISFHALDYLNSGPGASVPASMITVSAGSCTMFGTSANGQGAMALYTVSGTGEFHEFGTRVAAGFGGGALVNSSSGRVSMWGNVLGLNLADRTIQDKLNSINPAVASQALDATAGNHVEVNITSNIAVVIQAPSNTPPGGQSQELTITFINNSGGALGTAPTFATGAGAFLTSAAVVNPAGAQGVTYKFRWSPFANGGARYREVSRTVSF